MSSQKRRDFYTQKEFLTTYGSQSFQKKTPRMQGNNDTLYVVSVLSSCFGHQRRFQLGQEFIQRIEDDERRGRSVALYVVEVAYDSQPFVIQMKHTERHLKVRLPLTALFWNKETMINFAVSHLPPDWQYLAWVDADIEFLDPFWAETTIQTFQETGADMLQLFSFCRYHLSSRGPPYHYYPSHIYMHHESTKRQNGLHWHPGFAYACTRHAYKQMGGLFDYCITGSGDYIILMAVLQSSSLPSYYSKVPRLTERIIEFSRRVRSLSIYYAPMMIAHHYHGERKNRRYAQRHEILSRHQYDPHRHLYRDPSTGLLLPTRSFTKQMSKDMLDFFYQRREVAK